MNREEVVLERRAGPAQPALQPAHLADPPLEPPSEFLTSGELAALLGYRGKTPQSSANQFTKRHGLKRYWRSQTGRYWRSQTVALVKRADVMAVLEGRRRMGVSHGR